MLFRLHEEGDVVCAASAEPEDVVDLEPRLGVYRGGLPDDEDGASWCDARSAPCSERRDPLYRHPLGHPLPQPGRKGEALAASFRDGELQPPLREVLRGGEVARESIRRLPH